MKTIFVFLFLLIGVLSLNDQSYLTGFCNQLGFTQDQITANINCLNNANTDIQNFKDAVSTNGASISDSQILNFIQQVKLVLVDDCSSFQDKLVDYFSANTNAPVFQDALCNNMDTYNSQIKQKLVNWATALDTNQDSDAGRQHAFIYQVLFGVVSPIPTASFTTSVNQKVVTFDAGASTVLGGSITNYAWDFGEPNSGSNTASGSSSTATHTYASYGTYTIVLTVTDNEGATATYSTSVTLNSPPTASFTTSIAGKTVSFDAAGSTDSDGTISTYAWNFGESSSPSNTASGSTTTASHTYSTYGTYAVVLTVTDNHGATGTKTTNVVISASGPSVSFTTSASITGNQVTFTSTTTGTIVTYAWDFGDPTSSFNTGSVAKPYHVYAAAGTYTVSLTVTDNTGATATASKSVTVTSSCGSLLHFIEGWSTSGDCDITVRTPNGKVINYLNTGPSSGTDQGTWFNDSANGSDPEEICWATGKTPPSGTYNICLTIYNAPSPSVTAQLNVINGGVVSYYSKTFTSTTSTNDCLPTDSAYVASITYP